MRTHLQTQGRAKDTVLQAYLSHPAFSKNKGVGLLEQLLGLERLAEEDLQSSRILPMPFS